MLLCAFVKLKQGTELCSLSLCDVLDRDYCVLVAVHA